MYLISACLAGINCKYDGHNNYNRVAKWLLDNNLAIPICPEELGGLPTPRVPSERVGDKVLSKEGEDVTKKFTKGASKSLEKALENNITIAILQARSPSCGVHQIYDGTFKGNLIKGEGLTTKLLREHNIKVITIDTYINEYHQKDLQLIGGNNG